MTTKSFIKTIGEKGLLADYNTEGKKLQTELVFDTTPTAGSTNPVTSDGIKTAIDAKQNNLTAGDNITIDGNTISSDQVFVATYGTSKYAEVKAEYDAGKICIIFMDDLYYYLNLIDKDRIRFISQTKNPAFSIVTVYRNDRWEVYSSMLQSKLKFDNEPKAGSTNPVTSDGIKKALDSRVPAPTSTTGTQVLKCINGVIQWVSE